MSNLTVIDSNLPDFLQSAGVSELTKQLAGKAAGVPRIVPKNGTGFGNVIELDPTLVVPDPTKSIADGAIEPWTKPHYRSWLTEVKRAARHLPLRLDVPWRRVEIRPGAFEMEAT